MNAPDSPMDRILKALQERAKELECLYRVEEILKQLDTPLNDILRAVIQAIPAGYQFPNICQARIVYKDTAAHPPGFIETPWVQGADVVVGDEILGRIDVFYTEETPRADEGPFLQEERKLINSIAERLGHYLAHRRLQSAFKNLESARLSNAPRGRGQWWIILEFLRRTDQGLLNRISRKMLNHLCWRGVAEAVSLLHRSGHDVEANAVRMQDENVPIELLPSGDAVDTTDETFRIAERHLAEDEIVDHVQQWIREERARFLVTAASNPDSSLDEITEAIRRLHHIPPDEIEFSMAARKGLRVSLIEHFFTDQLQFVNVAKRFIDLDDYYDLVHHIIHPAKSRGKLGGKSAGLFLASQILHKTPESSDLLSGIKVPRTWYLTSDGILDFIQYNNLEDVHTQKYMEIDQVRREYPNIVQTFKNSQFPPETIQGLSMVLDDFEGCPIIVRSSSLLEDRFGAAFSGKYKSLFLANQGTKQARLTALQDAIAEVYASIFGPDPIEYRAERGLLDVYEEMGIMIQEVVGRKIGKYFLPAFAGVAFSNNEFRWSARIRREDGLLRLVPGLGTRAVDRLKDDYPVLMAPGQPNLRVNATTEEVVRYSPKKLDVINLETGAFETVGLIDFLREVGDAFPQVYNIVSILDEDRIRRPFGNELDFQAGGLLVTFEGLISATPFIKQVKAMLEILQKELETPVDIEFASDGTDLYLLQCRPQSHAGGNTPAQIPHDIPTGRVIFSANRFISNGTVPNISHIVYVDPGKYNELSEYEELIAVGRAVGKLNKLLPKRQFILMGPGRWGSRGDIRLGVNVTYSDINNAAVLVEIARKKGNYLPDLSFGTHFFQDLVEASIRYLPLYPDDPEVAFDEEFLLGSDSILAELLPEFSFLSDTVRVIDVPRVRDGLILRVLMNADANEAVALLSPPPIMEGKIAEAPGIGPERAENHWRWRLGFAERIAADIEPEKFGVVAFYVFGSTKNAAAGPASDIDILVHFRGSSEQRKLLESWLEGWSLCLSEINFLRTGYRTAGLLDVHILTDEDIACRTSFAVKIDAVTDAARKLPMKPHEP